MTTIISPFDVFPGLETQKKKVVASTQLCAISWAEKDENEEEAKLEKQEAPSRLPLQ